MDKPNPSPQIKIKKEFITKSNKFLFFYAGWLFTFILMASASVEDWVQKADMPIRRLFFSTMTVTGQIYTIGGMLAEPIDFVDAYDPDKDAWEQKAHLPAARAGVVTCVVEGKIYAIGGWNGQSPALGTVEEYDPATDTWNRKSDMPNPVQAQQPRALREKYTSLAEHLPCKGLFLKPLKNTIQVQIHGRRKQRGPHREWLWQSVS